MKNDYSKEEIIKILSKHIRKFTSNENSSISYGKARQILGSILFCMEAEIEDENEENYGIVDLNKISAQEAFKLGLARKRRKIRQAKELYKELGKTFCACQNRCYYDTIIEGIPEFFKWYDVEFDAANNILTFDYPLLYPISGMVGVDLIYEYLQRTKSEQDFLNQFPPHKITELLNNYHLNHSQLIINICKLVLRNAIGCSLVGKSIYELFIDQKEREMLKKIGAHKTLEELEEILEASMDKILVEDLENKEAILNYLKQDIKEFTFEFKTGLDNNCLEKLFLEKREEKKLNQVIFQNGTPMEDEKLRVLIDEMRGIRYFTDKLELLKRHIKSLEDLKEILKECFYEDEFKDIFKLLSVEEIHVLKEEVTQKLEFDQELYKWEEYLIKL